MNRKELGQKLRSIYHAARNKGAQLRKVYTPKMKKAWVWAKVVVRGLRAFRTLEIILILALASAIILPFVHFGQSGRTALYVVGLIPIAGLLVFWYYLYRQTKEAPKGAKAASSKPTPAKAPATRRDWMSLLPAVIIITLAVGGMWWAHAHWDEWFPKDVQCGVMSETHQSCVVKPGETATITIPVVKHPAENNICLMLDGVLDHLWYTTSLSGTKREYSADSPPKNVTSYTFDAGARGAKITYFFAKKPC